MNLIEAVNKSNIAKLIKNDLIEKLEALESCGRFTTKNSKPLPTYLNKEMQAIVSIMRGVSLKMKTISEELTSRGYQFEADHADVASRFLAVTVSNFLQALVHKERKTVERAYMNADVLIRSTDENRYEKDRLDDITANVATDDIYLLAEFALETCKGCRGKEECSLKDTMIRLRVPISRDEGKCPYVNTVCEVA